MNNLTLKGWRPAKVPLTLGLEKKPPLQTYQILVEGIWGDGRVGQAYSGLQFIWLLQSKVGTIAIDDISFFDGNCTGQLTTDFAAEITSWLIFMKSCMLTVQPSKAAAVFGECSFERDLCGYRNQSGTGPGPEVTQFASSPSKAALISNKRQSVNRLSVSSKESLTWKLATPTSRPANLQDHTFRAPSEWPLHPQMEIFKTYGYIISRISIFRCLQSKFDAIPSVEITRISRRRRKYSQMFGILVHSVWKVCCQPLSNRTNII